MAAKKATTKKEVKKTTKKTVVLEPPMDWKFNKTKSAVSKTIYFENAIAALAFAAKITVHATIFKLFPELCIKEGELTITIHAGKEVLTKEELALAARIDSLQQL